MIITNHKTLFAYNAEQLDALIEAAIADGWQPQGGVTAASEPGRGVVLYRAMVKYAPPSFTRLPPGVNIEWASIPDSGATPMEINTLETAMPQADGKRKKANK